MRIIHFDLAGKFRGGQRQALLLHQNLLKNGIDSYLVADKDGLLYEKCKNEKIKNCIGIHIKKIKPGIFNRLLAAKNIKKIIKKINPYILHFHEPTSLIYGLIFRKIVSFETRRVSFPIKDSSIKLKYSKIDVHVGVSDEISEYLKSKGLVKVYTVRSSIDLNRFKNLENSEVLINKKEKNLLYIGSFSEMKGIDVLLKALKLLLNTHKSIMLHMVGDGELFDTYKELANELGIIDSVTFYGRTNKPELFYREADVVIVPSRNGEGSNGIIKEAMASGKIVIASDLICNQELIENNVDGIIFINEDEKDLSNKMKDVLSGEKTVFEEDIQNKAITFSDEIMSEAYIKLYKNI